MTTAASPSSAARTDVPNDLAALWLPFTPNRAFKKRPRLIARSKDMHYYTPEGRAILDATAALWCCNAGHNRAPIVAAIQRQAAELDFSPTFQFAHPLAFALASRLAELAPADLDHVFFTNSGSEAADTALKIAIAYHNVRGQGSRQRLIGRERGYHGVGFGGISVGGMVNNRKFFGSLLAGVDHLPATYNREHQAFTKGEPEWGGHLADALEGIVGLHDASTIAAVIVEPMAGSTGVLPPPKGYLQRLREICDKYGILLIFDEVITGFGRLGPRLRRRALRRRPGHDHLRQGRDLRHGADGRRHRAQARLRRLHAGARARDRALPRLHLFGPSARLRGGSRDARRLSRRAAVRARQGARAEMVRRDHDPERPAERARHPLRRPRPARSTSRRSPAARPCAAIALLEHSFHEAGIMLRISGDTIELMPPLIVSENQIDEIVEKVGASIKAVA